MRCLISVLAALSVLRGETIGPEAQLSDPVDGAYGLIVNNRPGDGTTVTIDPPRFSWSYNEDPTSTVTTLRSFNLQIDDDVNFGSPAVNVVTPYNFYNFLAPLGEGTWYWRVDYNEAGAPDWGPTRSFVIPAATPTWDRSDLADEGYLTTNGAHPHIGFTSANRAAVKTWLDSNNPDGTWTATQTQAADVITKPWWPNSAPSGADEWYIASGVWASRVQAAAMVWGLTQNAAYEGVAENLVVLADYFRTNGYADDDIISNGVANGMMQTLAVGYDWAYDTLTVGQRASMIDAMEDRAIHIRHGTGTATGFFEDKYPDGSTAKVNIYSHGKRGDSHQFDNFTVSMLIALSAFADDADIRELFDMGMNYLLGVYYPYGWDGSANQGIGYGFLHNFIDTGPCNPLSLSIQSDIIFPELDLWKNPVFTGMVNWWGHTIPVGFRIRGNEPWGDSGSNTVYSDYWRHTYFGKHISMFTGSTIARRHHVNAGARTGSEVMQTLPYGFYYSTPSESDAATGGMLFKDTGWGFSTTHIPNKLEGFESGAGMVIQARPRGSENGHSNAGSDGDVQFWYKGALVTDGGSGGGQAGGWNKTPWSHNVPLVSGLGQAHRFEAPNTAYLNKFIGYKDTANYTYFCADLTNGYPVQSFTVGGYFIHPAYATPHSGGPLSGLQKVHRHVFFHKSPAWWVIWDDLAHNSAVTYTFQWHVYPNTVTMDATNFDWDYTVLNNASQSVPVYVDVINANATLSLSHLTGSNVAMTPFGADMLAYVPDGLQRAHYIKVSNASAATTFQFLTAVVPVDVGGSAPTIARIDDKTADITVGVTTKRVTFDPAGSGDYVVDLFDAGGGGPSIPTAPTIGSASGINTSTIRVPWTDNSSNEDGFRVYQASSEMGSYVQVDTAGANIQTRDISGLSPNTTYWFKVSAYNAEGESALSSATSATTQAATPGYERRSRRMLIQ